MHFNVFPEPIVAVINVIIMCGNGVFGVRAVGRQAPPPSLEVLGFSQAKKPLFKINILFNQLNMIQSAILCNMVLLRLKKVSMSANYF